MVVLRASSGCPKCHGKCHREAPTAFAQLAGLRAHDYLSHVPGKRPAVSAVDASSFDRRRLMPRCIASHMNKHSIAPPLMSAKAKQAPVRPQIPSARQTGRAGMAGSFLLAASRVCPGKCGGVVPRAGQWSCRGRRVTGVSAYPGVVMGYRRIHKRWYPVSVVASTTTRTQVRMVTGQLLTAARTVRPISRAISFIVHLLSVVLRLFWDKKKAPISGSLKTGASMPPRLLRAVATGNGRRSTWPAGYAGSASSRSVFGRGQVAVAG
jgi:hypothetical protein